jgi:hypothetical protein
VVVGEDLECFPGSRHVTALVTCAHGGPSATPGRSSHARAVLDSWPPMTPVARRAWRSQPVRSAVARCAHRAARACVHSSRRRARVARPTSTVCTQGCPTHPKKSEAIESVAQCRHKQYPFLQRLNQIIDVDGCDISCNVHHLLRCFSPRLTLITSFIPATQTAHIVRDFYFFLVFGSFSICFFKSNCGVYDLKKRMSLSTKYATAVTWARERDGQPVADKGGFLHCAEMHQGE